MFPLLFQSYWRDEAFSILMAQRPVVEIIRLCAHDFSPPLYFILLRMWGAVFGMSEVSTRSLSFIFYLLTLCTIMVLIRYSTKIKTWVSGALVLMIGCMHPLMIGYAFETRMYTMTAWLASLSWYCLLRKRWGWFAVVTILGLYTHYFMFLIYGVQMLYLLISNFPAREHLMRLARKQYMSILWIFVPLGLCVPWLVFFIQAHYFGTSVSFWVPKPMFTDLITIPSLITLGYDTFSNFKYDVRPFSLCIYGLMLLAYVQKPKSTPAILFPLILWTIVPGVIVWTLAQYTTSLFLPRYLIVSSPALVILVVVCIDMLRPMTRVILIGLLFIVVVSYMGTSARFVQTHQIFIPTKEDLRSRIYTIKHSAKPGEYLLVRSELDYHVAQVYWYSPDHVKILGKTYQEIPEYVGKTLIPESAILTRPYPKIPGYILNTDRTVERL